MTVNSLEKITSGMKVILRIEQKIFELTLINDQIGEPGKGTISVESPLGSALVGKKMNDEFFYLAPTQKMIHGKILDFDKPNF